MSLVSYNSNRLIPGPFCSITKEYNRTSDGAVIGKIYTLTLTNELVAHRGSPSSSGSFHTLSTSPADEVINNNQRLAAILRKQEAIRELFSVDGLNFEIQSMDGSQPLRCNPRVQSIEFASGPWHTTCPYTIVLQADELYPLEEDDLPFPSAYLTDASESWSIDTDETPQNLDLPRQYKITHSVSAVGKRFYDAGSLVKEAWQQARDYVHNKLGFDHAIALSSGINNLPTFYSGYNHIRSENIDKSTGSYAITEAWILTSGAHIEDFQISINEGVDNGFTNVSINGNIQGLEERNSSMGLINSKYTNANNQFIKASGLAFSRAQSYANRLLNLEPLTSQVGINPIAGNITYTFEYNDRPSRIVTGTKSEVVAITNSYEVDSVASIPVLGRNRGPILQSLSTKNVAQRGLNLELIFPNSYIPSSTSVVNRIQTYNPRLHSPQSTEITNIIAAANPLGTALNNIGELASESYVTERSETWNPTTLQYSLNINWIYE